MANKANSPPSPINITIDPDGTVHLGTTVLPPDAVAALKEFLAGRDEVILAPAPGIVLRLYMFAKSLLAAAEKGDRMATVTEFGSFFGSLCAFLKLADAPPIKKKGAPRKAGAVVAVRESAAAVTKFATELNNAHVDAKDLSGAADDVEVFWSLETMLKAGLEKIARIAIPEAKTMVDSMRRVLLVADPILDTHTELAVALTHTLAYLKDPHVKGARTRKTNKNKAKKLVAKTQADILPQARDQVRGEIKTQVNDHLAGLFNSGMTSSH